MNIIKFLIIGRNKTYFSFFIMISYAELIKFPIFLYDLPDRMDKITSKF